jgi:hypothetical protein
MKKTTRTKPSKQKIANANKYVDTTTNWSQAQDRSEDLINETDPFIQEPQKKFKIPKDDRL